MAVVMCLAAVSQASDRCKVADFGLCRVRGGAKSSVPHERKEEREDSSACPFTRVSRTRVREEPLSRDAVPDSHHLYACKQASGAAAAALLITGATPVAVSCGGDGAARSGASGF